MKNAILAILEPLWKNVVFTPSFLLLCVPAIVLFALGSAFDAQMLLLLYVVWKLRALVAVFAVFCGVASIGS